MISVIFIPVVSGVLVAVSLYACCVSAGRADAYTEKRYKTDI